MVAGARAEGFRRNEALRSCQITPDHYLAGSGRPARRPEFQLVGDAQAGSYLRSNEKRRRLAESTWSQRLLSRKLRFRTKARTHFGLQLWRGQFGMGQISLRRVGDSSPSDRYATGEP